MPPHADAVHLVDDDEADADRAEGLDERGVPKPLRRGVEQSCAPGRDVLDAARRLVGIERRVDERRRGRDLGRQLVDLVLHQRDQGREDECRLGPQHRRQLVGERLARAGRHQRERVATLDGGADDLLLAGPEVGEAEELLKAGSQVGHANECTGRIGTDMCDSGIGMSPPALSGEHPVSVLRGPDHGRLERQTGSTPRAAAASASSPRRRSRPSPRRPRRSARACGIGTIAWPSVGSKVPAETGVCPSTTHAW